MKRQTKSAFLWIIKVLEKHKIPYRVSGGFAAKVYGTERELVDIDIDIHDKDVDKILPFVKKYIIAGPKRYKDRQWNLYSMSLRYKGQEIDLCGTDSVKIFDKRKKKWVKLKTNFSKTTKKKIYGKIVKVQNKKDLIHYKNVIRRKVDIKDIRAILNDKNQNVFKQQT